MTTFNGEEFIYGYPKDELMLFALACREAGITNEKLHEINFNIEWAVDAVRKEVETVVRKNLDDIVNRIAKQTEPQTEMEKSGSRAVQTARCLNCHNAKACKENHWEVCKYEPWKLIAVEDEPQTEYRRVGQAIDSVTGKVLGETYDVPQTDCSWK